MTTGNWSGTGLEDAGGAGDEREPALQLCRRSWLSSALSAEWEALKQVSARCETSNTDSGRHAQLSEKEPLTISQKLITVSFFNLL